ncbi:response regulator transcription factor [Mucilaginibacter celer]|uniref:Response regulator n=1 Tax=Mucilaginibacter celer TaxID=2305508 RepID=A0A494VYI6_9SPHI|nr:response regulator transcription factor [Mucilaginibacter celer]AYL96225.1 response regulator [Mucilaginibacter celer]
MSTSTIKIGIVDDHLLFRRGMIALLREYADIEVVCEAGNGKQLQECLAAGRIPDVVLMDVNMPVMDGYDTTSWLKTNYPDIAVLALSMYEDDKSVIKMIKCGAGGYVLKECHPAELKEAVTALKQRGVYLNELVSGKMYRSFAKPAETTISPKESEFLKLCCSDLTYKEIADLMSISPRTVDNHRESLFMKLQVKSRVGLVLYAIKNNVVSV